MFYIEVILAKILTFIAKLINENRNTNLVGSIMLKLDKNFVSKFKIDTNNVIVITGTNGKSTVNNLVSHIFKSANRIVISNLEGANLMGGIATSLIKNCTLSGNFKNTYFIFEVDERTLPYFFSSIKAKNLAITNIQKDQVCRNGDPDYIYQIIKKIINPNMHLFLNNDDPRSKSFEKLTKNITYYGVTKNKYSYQQKGKLTTTMPCPICHSKIEFDYYNIANIGKFHCSNCEYQSEDKILYNIDEVNFQEETFTICNEKINMPNIQPFFLYGYALAYAIATEFKIKDIKDKFKNFKNIGGRTETLKYKDKQIKYIRIKQENPETLQSAIDAVSKDKQPKIFILGLCLLKDFKPYYSNTFYSYDCDFKNLIESNVEKYICFSKTVSFDTANRLLYEGIEKDKITIIDNDNVDEILKEIDKYPINNVYLITWLHTYEDIKKYLEKESE